MILRRDGNPVKWHKNVHIPIYCLLILIYDRIIFPLVIGTMYKKRRTNTKSPSIII